MGQFGGTRLMKVSHSLVLDFTQNRFFTLVLLNIGTQTVRYTATSCGTEIELSKDRCFP
jgi:hypothetical protein